MLNQNQIFKIEQFINSGLSKIEAARNMNISLGTIYKYTNLLKIIPFQTVKGSDDAKISKLLIPYLDLINENISRKIYNANKIYQNLVIAGFKGSYILVNNYIRKKELENNPNKVRMYKKMETGPGQQAQVDWGYFGKIKINGELVNLYAFVYVLSFSRMLYVEFVASQKQRTFQECHIHAFEKLGVPKQILYDNLKTVVTSREKINGEVKINYNFDFQNFASYYKFKPEACHPYYPQGKGKVEASVKYVRNNFMNGEAFKKTFSTFEEINEKLSQWLENANSRTHGTTKEQPIKKWQEEKTLLQNIENLPKYGNYDISSRRASKISMVTYKRSSYWVPPEYAQKKIGVKEIENKGLINLEFYCHGKKIIEYPLAHKMGSWIIPEDKTVLNGKNIKTEKSIKKSSLWNTKVEVRDLAYYNQFINT